MKKIIFLLIIILLTGNIQGQNIPEKIAENACKYLKNINDLNILNDSIRGSLTKSMIEIMKDFTSEEQSKMITVEDIRGTIHQAYKVLPGLCYNVRKLIIENKKSEFYIPSAISKANLHFERGNNYLQIEDYKKAIKEFKSAIKIDPNFIFAIDHLAIAYRKQKNYTRAIKYYKKSLEIFPEGNLALLNIAVCYTNIKDDTNAIDTYQKLKFLYPNDPEGYFGLAKLLSIQEDFENALDNLFVAHRMYIEPNSEYKKDSQKLLDFINARLEKLGKSKLFIEIAKKHNFTVK